MAGIIRAILFDLDDTLLGNNMDRFLPAYFGLLAPHVAGYIPPDTFMPALLAATRAMIANMDPQVTNQQAFSTSFFPRVGRTQEEMMPVFDEFYATRFGSLRSHTRRLPEARLVVQAALDAGYDVVIATNPLFPEAAIQQRLEWAGLGDLSFKLVTSYEVMHFCKPHPDYYAEIAQRIGWKPDECIMVGDDWGNDIAPALQAGLQVYWINPAAELPSGFSEQSRGTLAQFWESLGRGKPNTAATAAGME